MESMVRITLMNRLNDISEIEVSNRGVYMQKNHEKKEIVEKTCYCTLGDKNVMYEFFVFVPVE